MSTYSLLRPAHRTRGRSTPGRRHRQRRGLPRWRPAERAPPTAQCVLGRRRRPRRPRAVVVLGRAAERTSLTEPIAQLAAMLALQGVELVAGAHRSPPVSTARASRRQAGLGEGINSGRNMIGNRPCRTPWPTEGIPTMRSGPHIDPPRTPIDSRRASGMGLPSTESAGSTASQSERRRPRLRLHAYEQLVSIPRAIR